MLVNNSKKRPNNCIIGRTFDNHLLDMFEFQIDGFVSLNEFESGLDINPGARPVVMFLGDIFESNSKYRRIKNLLNDF